ncbi:alpha/beta fold hydrolase [Halobacillus sp. Marseille-P3879]|uniref:alpha/beta fold hydrolase n=1 Tax=Halobacillus sp. Marseille-P3879 TaxID=2045014 RepID=UPI000C7CE85B|nr:alpha/beta hydrolase [Halobacillus sp. Marseille-P3879]
MTSALFDTSKGLVEYSYIGKGPVLLLLKGGHCTRDTDLSHNSLVYEGYSLLTISRPGYDYTEVSTGRTPDEFASTIIEVLDHLRIEVVTVIAVSAAGPTGIALAVNYRDRVNKLIMEAALLTPFDQKTKAKAKLLFGRGEKAVWKGIRTLLKFSPNLAIKQIMNSLTTDPVDDYLSSLSANDRRFIYNMLATSQSGKGFLLDIHHNADLLHEVQVPVLGMYTKKDRSVDYSNAVLLRSAVPNCEIYDVESDSHLIWIGKNAASVWRKRLEFITQ